MSEMPQSDAHRLVTITIQYVSGISQSLFFSNSIACRRQGVGGNRYCPAAALSRPSVAYERKPWVLLKSHELRQLHVTYGTPLELCLTME